METNRKLIVQIKENSSLSRGWYFLDEFNQLHGPYKSRDDAHEGLSNYACYLMEKILERS